MSVLKEIVEKKKERLAHAKGRVSLSELKSRISESEGPRDFKKAVKRQNGRISLIAEIKKASPSKGVIREDFDCAKIARIYKEKGVDAISVLTEEDFFQGKPEYIPLVKQMSRSPVLRKDFIFDEYQIYESRALGADAILLIASLLEKSRAEEYLHICRELGIAVLFEVHNHNELEKALHVDADIIGINNRNLETLKVDMDTTFMLKREIPKDRPNDRIVVSESGIETREDVLRIEQAGIDAMLIGTSLMKANDIGKKIDELRG